MVRMMMTIDGKFLALGALAVAAGCIAGYIAFSKDAALDGINARPAQDISSAREELWKDIDTGQEVAYAPDIKTRDNSGEDDAAEMAAMEPAAGDDKNACGFNQWLNKEMDKGVVETLTQMKRPYRIIAPGSIYTQDFQGDRVNFNIDDKGVVLDIWCG